MCVELSWMRNVKCGQFCYNYILCNTRTPDFKMAAPIFETCHVACCANRTPNAVSWGRGGTVAFGTCHSVALYDPLVVEFLCLFCELGCRQLLDGPANEPQEP